MYHVELIDYTKDFLSARDEWNRLLLEHPDQTPFMHHEWIHYTYEARFWDAEPFVLKIKRQKMVVGYVPLCLYKLTLRNINLRAVGFPENPDAFTNSIICSEAPERVFSAILKFFQNEFREWDVLLLDKIPEYNPLYQTVIPLAGRLQSKSFILRAGFNLMVQLKQPWDDYYADLSRNFRRSLHGIRNRLAQFGHINFEAYTTQDGSLDTAFAEFLAVSSGSWKQDTGVALPSQPSSLAFFKMLTRFGLPDAHLIIYVLRINGVAAAVEFHLRSRFTEYALRADYHENYSKQSPGTFLDYSIIKNLHENGVQSYQLGPGLNPYKLKWMPARQTIKQFIIANGTLKARLFWLLELNHRRAAHMAGTLSELFTSGRFRETAQVDVLG
jgi:CelD/BcsL family acetyltransferase involved in cellulose biosynthesis